MTDCGCPQTSPSSLNCGASLQVPIDQLNCPTSSPCPTAGGSPSISFHRAINGFVVPAVGGQSSIAVPNGLLFVPGQWIQFVNPAGTFRIISITGNVLTLTNAAADGVTAITGNPVPPYQYPENAAFVTVDQPVQLTASAFAELVQTAIESLEGICVNSIPDQGVSEHIWLLGYLKSNLGEESNESCLRKQSLAYIDENGVFHFDGSIIAESFSVPVPDGGLVASNSTSLNPNGGTGDGFLIPFYNPLTGTVTYIDLFSGVENGHSYMINMSSTGQITLTRSDSLKSFYPDKQVHLGDGSAYSGYPSQLVDVATIIGEAVPSWVTHVRVDIAIYTKVDTDSAIGIKLNTQFAAKIALADTKEYNYFKSIVIPITDGKFTLEIITYNDLEATAPVSNFNFQGTGADKGNVRISISQLIRSL